MTNQEIINLYNGIAAIGQQQLPAKIAYALLRDKKIIEPYFQAIEECRLDIIQQYAEIDGAMYSVPAINQEKFTKEINELYSFNNEDIYLQKIKLPDDISISLDVLEVLMPIISEED